MPIFEIETPEGVFEVDAPDEKAALGALKVGDTSSGVSPDSFPPHTFEQHDAPAYRGNRMTAMTEGSHAGLMGGFDDEIFAGGVAPFKAVADWIGGDGFDVGRAYDNLYKREADRKEARRAAYPVSGTIGEMLGGLALGGGAAKSGLSLAGRNVPRLLGGKTAAAAAEGAGYGALYGAGEAKPGERLEGAGWGALTGAGTGALTEKIGQAFVNRAARKATPPAPGIDDLQRETDAFYAASRAAGVGIKPQAVNRLVGNVQIAAGRLNPQLRPGTAGVVDDALALQGKNITLEELDEFRQQIGLAMKDASPQDQRTLMRVKSAVDGFDGTLAPADVTGNATQGFDMLKKGRALNARKEKTALIEQMIDFADVNTGRYTQSGMANTIRQGADGLYKKIMKGQVKGFSPEEIGLLRQMAKGGSASQMVNWLAKLSPRGPVSLMANMLGASGGAAMLGPFGAAVGVPMMAGGMVASRAADRGAVAAANSLRDAAARGFVYRPQLPPNKARPFIGGATAGTTGLTRR